MFFSLVTQTATTKLKQSFVVSDKLMAPITKRGIRSRNSRHSKLKSGDSNLKKASIDPNVPLDFKKLPVPKNSISSSVSCQKEPLKSIKWRNNISSKLKVRSWDNNKGKGFTRLGRSKLQVRNDNENNQRNTVLQSRISYEYSHETKNKFHEKREKLRDQTSKQTQNARATEIKDFMLVEHLTNRRSMKTHEHNKRKITNNDLNKTQMKEKYGTVALKTDIIWNQQPHSTGSHAIVGNDKFSLRSSNIVTRKNDLETFDRKSKLCFPPPAFDVLITCQPGLENVLSQECSSMGLPHRIDRGGIVLMNEITVEDIMVCHLYLGTASSILVRCGTPFTSRALGELKRKVQKIPWNQMIHYEKNGSQKSPLKFKVKVKSAKSRLLHSTAIRDQVLSGIYSSLGLCDIRNDAVNERRVDNDNEERALSIVVHVYRDRVQISIDTSITPVHHRMYKLETGKAPLREDIAYAFLHSAGWKPDYQKFPIVRPNGSKISRADTGRVEYSLLLDTFCGSGAIAIEAACILYGLPPGRLRPAPMYGTRFYNPTLWKNLVNQAMQSSVENRSPCLNAKIVASDRDLGVIKSLRANADRAGVLNMIVFHHCAFSANPWFEKPLDMIPTLDDNKCILIASNLPFGLRIRSISAKTNRTKEFLPLYQSIGKQIVQLENFGCKVSAILLTNDAHLVRRSGIGGQTNTVLTTNLGDLTVHGVYRTPST